MLINLTNGVCKHLSVCIKVVSSLLKALTRLSAWLWQQAVWEKLLFTTPSTHIQPASLPHTQACWRWHEHLSCKRGHIKEKRVGWIYAEQHQLNTREINGTHESRREDGLTGERKNKIRPEQYWGKRQKKGKENTEASWSRVKYSSSVIAGSARWQLQPASLCFQLIARSSTISRTQQPYPPPSSQIQA